MTSKTLTRISVRLVADTTAITKAMRQAKATLGRLSLSLQNLSPPPHQPPPLSIDGHEYHRRARSRRGRRSR